MTKLTDTHSWSGLCDFKRFFFRMCIRIQDECRCYSIISAIKMMLYCWMINHHKTTGIVKKCRNKQLLSLCGSLWQIACFLIVHKDKCNIKLNISSNTWKRMQGGMRALFNVMDLFYWLRVFIKSGLIACCKMTFYFCCCGQTCWSKCLVVEL